MGKATKFGLGILIGAAAAYVGSLFIDEDVRKKHQKIAKEKLGDLKKYTQESRVVYQEAKKDLVKNLKVVGKSLQEVDKTKYQKVLAKTLEEIKKKHKVSDKIVAELKIMFESDYKKVKKDVSESEGE